MLRLLFSRVGRPYAGSAIAFSFNDPRGMCPECSRIGRKIGVDLEAFRGASKSLNEGAIRFPEFAPHSWDRSFLTQSGLFDNDKKLSKYTDAELHRLP